MIIADHPELARRLRHSRQRLIRLAAKRHLIDDIADEWSDTVSKMAKHCQAVIDDVDQDQAILDKLVTAVEAEPWALILAGDYDTGKTFSAIAVAHELAWRQKTVKIVACRNMLASIKPGGGSSLAAYTNAGVLVLDGLSEVELSKWDVEQVKAVLLDRYERSEPTIVTTNLEPGQLRRKLGDAIWTRLQDGGIVLSFNDTGRRRNRQRFTKHSDIDLWSRLAAYRDIATLPQHLQSVARDQITAEVAHDPLDCQYTFDDAEAIATICDGLLNEWQHRVMSVRQALEPLATGPNAPHQTYEWFADDYERQTGKRFRLSILDPAHITGEQIETIETIADKVGILDLDLDVDRRPAPSTATTTQTRRTTSDDRHRRLT